MSDVACICQRGATQPFDFVIVGAGAMGLLAARTLAVASERILVLETGGTDSIRGGIHPWNADAAAGLRLDDGLANGIGGTGKFWAGQCVAPESADLLAEAARGNISWPYPYEDLQHYIDEAFVFAGLRPALVVKVRQQSAKRLQGLGSFRAWPTLYMPSHRLDRAWARLIAASPQIEIWSRTQAVSSVSQSNHVRVNVVCEHGESQSVEGSVVVLAAGTLGNAALLLSSGAEMAIPEATGQHLSEHVTAIVASVDRPSNELIAALGTFYSGRTRSWPKLSLTEPSRRELGLPAVSVDAVVRYHPRVMRARAYLSTRHSAEDDRPPVRDLAMAVLGLAWARLKGSAVDARAIVSVDLQLNLEQVSRDNCVTLGPGAEPQVRWSVDDEDLKNIRACGHLLAAEWPESFGTLRLRPDLDDDERLRSDCAAAHHLSGTTRMGSNPHTSVVDEWQRLHTDPRIVVIGASVFPTPGWVNPTLLAWACALRALGDLTKRAEASTAMPGANSAERKRHTPLWRPVWIAHRKGARNRLSA